MKIVIFTNCPAIMQREHGSLVVAMSSHISYLDTIPLLATQHDPGIYVHV